MTLKRYLGGGKTERDEVHLNRKNGRVSIWKIATMLVKVCMPNRASIHFSNPITLNLLFQSAKQIPQTTHRYPRKASPTPAPIPTPT